MNGGKIAVATGQTLTLGGGLVTGAVLSGPGGIATGASGETFVGSSTTASTALVSNSASDQFVTFTTKGPLSVAPGVNSAGTSTVVNFSDFTVAGCGSLTLGASSRRQRGGFPNVRGGDPGPGHQRRPGDAADNPGSSPCHSTPAAGRSSPPRRRPARTWPWWTCTVRTRSSPAACSSTTASSATAPAPTSQVIADYGALVKGAGTYADPVVTQNGGKFQAGNSPGQRDLRQLRVRPRGATITSSPSTTRPGSPGRAPTPTAWSAAGGW